MRTKAELKRVYSLMVFGLVMIIAGIVTAGLVLRQQSAISHPQNNPVTSKSTTIGLTSEALFTGNVFWGRYINDWSMSSDLKYAYPFSRLNEFNRDKYNAWIGGLECPTSPRINTTSAQQEAALEFNCRPEYLPEAAKYFTAFSLANNHTDNQGEQGFMETKQELDKVGIQYFGHYDPREVKENCEVIALPVTVQKSDQTTTKGFLPVAMCGFHGVFRIPPLEALAEMQQYSKIMPVFAMPQSGAEYKPAPDAIKTESYRQMIDNGADAVMGDHPHWVQSTEAHKGKLIVYSMGNFMFDQQFNQEVVRSAAIAVSIETNANQPDLDKWLKLGASCKAFKNNCLAQAEQQKLTKLDLRYEFSVIGSDNSSKITKPATEAQLASILQRLNWSNTIKQLTPPYSGR